MSKSSTSTTKPPSFRHEGKKHDLTSADVVAATGKSLDWVRTHASALGGVKKAWADGPHRPASWRFPSVGLKKRVAEVEKAMAAARANRRKTV